MGEALEQSRDEQAELLAKTLKSYLRLCTQAKGKEAVLKDTAFLTNLVTLLTDERPKVISYTVKLLLVLTEQENDVIMLKAVPGLETAVRQTSERPLSPSVLHSLLKICSRFNTIGIRKENSGLAADPPASSLLDGSSSTSAAAFGDLASGGTFRRKFVSKNSKQLVFQFEDIDEALQYEMESRLLRTRGVISVYFSTVGEHRRAIVRTLTSIQGQDIADVLFSAGCAAVTQIVKIDGVEEHFALYENEKKDKASLPLPEYLDDMLEVADPHSCLVTNEMSQKAQAGGQGWLSSLSSLFW